MLDQRGQLLRAALGFAGLPRPSYDRALWALRTWLDPWSGIGLVSVGMAHQGYDLQLTRYDERGWRATFDTTGMEHSLTSATHATQRAAWEALGERERTMMRLALVVVRLLASVGTASAGGGGPYLGAAPLIVVNDGLTWLILC